MNICVRNLSPEVTEKDLREAFEDFGKVSGVTVMNGQQGLENLTAFVDMPVETEARAAITYLDGVELRGQNLNVFPAQEAPAEESLEDEYSEYEEEYEEEDDDLGRGRAKKKRPGEGDKW